VGKAVVVLHSTGTAFGTLRLAMRCTAMWREESVLYQYTWWITCSSCPCTETPENSHDEMLEADKNCQRRAFRHI
jgi:hypothetical protein